MQGIENLRMACFFFCVCVWFLSVLLASVGHGTPSGTLESVVKGEAGWHKEAGHRRGLLVGDIFRCC